MTSKDQFKLLLLIDHDKRQRIMNSASRYIPIRSQLKEQQLQLKRWNTKMNQILTEIRQTKEQEDALSVQSNMESDSTPSAEATPTADASKVIDPGETLPGA